MTGSHTLAACVAFEAGIPIARACDALEGRHMQSVRAALLHGDWSLMTEPARRWVMGEVHQLNDYPSERCGDFEQPPLPSEFLPQPK